MPDPQANATRLIRDYPPHNARPVPVRPAPRISDRTILTTATILAAALAAVCVVLGFVWWAA